MKCVIFIEADLGAIKCVTNIFPQVISRSLFSAKSTASLENEWNIFISLLIIILEIFVVAKGIA